MTSWHYKRNGRCIGPVSERKLRSLIEAGKVAADTLVRREGDGNWTKVGLIRELSPANTQDEIYGLAREGGPLDGTDGADQDEGEGVREDEPESAPPGPLRVGECVEKNASRNGPYGCIGFLGVLLVTFVTFTLEMAAYGFPLLSLLVGVGGLTTLFLALSRSTRRVAVEVAEVADEEEWLFVIEHQLLGRSIRREAYPITRGCRLRTKQFARSGGVMFYDLQLLSAKGKPIITLMSDAFAKRVQQRGRTYSEEFGIPFQDQGRDLFDLPSFARFEADHCRLELKERKGRIALVVDSNEGNRRNPANMRFVWLDQQVIPFARPYKVTYRTVGNIHHKPLMVIREGFGIEFPDDDGLREAVQFIEQHTGLKFRWDNSESYG